jgi:hypothetical protein
VTHEESPNGGGNQRLTGDERWMVITLALGKEVVKEEALGSVTLFIREGEREEVTRSRTSVSGLRQLAGPAGL